MANPTSQQLVSSSLPCCQALANVQTCGATRMAPYRIGIPVQPRSIDLRLSQPRVARKGLEEEWFYHLPFHQPYSINNGFKAVQHR